MTLTQNRRAISVHDVGIVLCPAKPMTREALEALTFEVERVLYDHACGETFGAAVATSFDPPGIEIDLSIPAVSASLVNRRMSEILEALESHLEISLDLSGQTVEQHDAPIRAAATS